MQDKTIPMFTYGLESLKHFKCTSASCRTFNEHPQILTNVIVIWHHNIGKPNVFLGSTDGPSDSSFYDHYSLLVVANKNISNVDLALPNADSECNTITLMSPDSLTDD
jgi:hypothetical protein